MQPILPLAHLSHSTNLTFHRNESSGFLSEKNNWCIMGRRFSAFLRRLNFVARLLSWIRPFLAPLFAFNAVLHRGTVARLPAMAFISLCYVRDELKSSDGVQSVKQTWLAPHESFRTDAKCETGRVALGGWSSKSGLHPKLAPWFSPEVFPSDLLCLFRDGESGWASTSAELLASLAALVAFGHLAQPIPGAIVCRHSCVGRRTTVRPRRSSAKDCRPIGHCLGSKCLQARLCAK